jgi:hypothetical protein
MVHNGFWNFSTKLSTAAVGCCVEKSICCIQRRRIVFGDELNLAAGNHVAMLFEVEKRPLTIALPEVLKAPVMDWTRPSLSTSCAEIASAEAKSAVAVTPIIKVLLII